jgi:transcriptional regulator with XRE-family HTH domain
MAPIGIELKRERELRGISLQEIADATKINIRYLRDLEEDKLENLPGTFFLKGIIRSYAKYIGLDENTILNSYYESELHREKETETEEEEETQKTQYRLPTKVRRIFFSISLFLIFMAVLTLAYIFIYQKPKTRQVEEAVSTQPIQKSVPTPPPEMPVSVVEEEKEIVLDLAFLMETWIQIYADGERVIDGLKLEGEKVQVIAKEELLIHTGNAGGISVTLNNKSGKPFGESGAVAKDIRITLENMETFIEKEIEKEIVPI